MTGTFGLELDGQLRSAHDPRKVDAYGEVVLCAGRRWIRGAVFLRRADFTRRGFWRTSMGDLRGVNFRAGGRRIDKDWTVTVLLHTRLHARPVGLTFPIGHLS